MPITLEQSKVGMANKVDQQVIDEFRRGSFLLEKLVFDNAVSPGTGGSTLTYGYVKLKNPSAGHFRAINGEYPSFQAIRESAYADLKIFGGAFSLDRVIINTSGAVNELNFQLKEKIMGALNLFHYTVINGDSKSGDVILKGSFDGLDVILTGSDTEFNKESAIDLSTSQMMDTNYNEFLDLMNDFISTMKGKPTMLLINSKLLTKMKSIARRAGYYTRAEDAFGRSVDMWDGIPLVDLEDFYDGLTTKQCIPIDENGETSMYAVQMALDGFHGVSPQGNKLISTALPDLSSPGAIKKGDVEMVAAVVLKNTKKAGVFRRIQVQ